MATNQGKLFMLAPEKGKLRSLEAAAYVSEDQLQGFLANYPDLLAGDQINPEAPRRWLLVAREMGIPGETDAGDRWSLDHLFLDQDGIPTFVECKRASDTRARREVVAQMLDYAANGLVYWSMDRLRQAAAETANQQGTTLDDRVKELLQSDSDEEIQTYWSKVEERLRNGQVRLIFVVDETPKELRRLVEFLNEKMPDVEVLAVEIKQFLGEGHTILAPRVVGQTEAARSKKAEATQRGTVLTREEFLSRCSPLTASLFTEILNLAEAHGHYIKWLPSSFGVYTKNSLTGKKLAFAYGAVGKKDFLFSFEYLKLTPEQALPLRKELLATGIFRESGNYGLVTEPLDEKNGKQVIAVFKLILDRIETLFPSEPISNPR